MTCILTATTNSGDTGPPHLASSQCQLSHRPCPARAPSRRRASASSKGRLRHRAPASRHRRRAGRATGIYCLYEFRDACSHAGTTVRSEPLQTHPCARRAQVERGGSSSGRRYSSSPSSVVGSRARAARGASVGRPSSLRSWLTNQGSSTMPITRRRPPHLAHERTSTLKVRRSRVAQSTRGAVAKSAPACRRSQCATDRMLGASGIAGRDERGGRIGRPRWDRCRRWLACASTARDHGFRRLRSTRYVAVLAMGRGLRSRLRHHRAPPRRSGGEHPVVAHERVARRRDERREAPALGQAFSSLLVPPLARRSRHEIEPNPRKSNFYGYP